MLYLATELQGVKAVALDRDATNSKYYDLSIVAECQTDDACAIDLSDDERLILVADKAGGLKIINVQGKSLWNNIAPY